MSYEKIARAKALAHWCHEGQFRKYTNDPYIVHPEQVHAELCNWIDLFAEKYNLSDEDISTMECAAYLHDVWEDCRKDCKNIVTKEMIIEATDQATFDLVLELTNPSKDSTAPRKVRKQMDRDHLAEVSWKARILKNIDRTVNLKDIPVTEKDFGCLYAGESRLLLGVIQGADPYLAGLLLKQIEVVETWSKA